MFYQLDRGLFFGAYTQIPVICIGSMLCIGYILPYFSDVTDVICVFIGLLYKYISDVRKSVLSFLVFLVLVSCLVVSSVLLSILILTF